MPRDVDLGSLAGSQPATQMSVIVVLRKLSPWQCGQLLIIFKKSSSRSLGGSHTSLPESNGGIFRTFGHHGDLCLEDHISTKLRFDKSQSSTPCLTSYSFDFNLSLVFLLNCQFPRFEETSAVTDWDEMYFDVDTAGQFFVVPDPKVHDEKSFSLFVANLGLCTSSASSLKKGSNHAHQKQQELHLRFRHLRRDSLFRASFDNSSAIR